MQVTVESRDSADLRRKLDEQEIHLAKQFMRFEGGSALTLIGTDGAGRW